MEASLRGLLPWLLLTKMRTTANEIGASQKKEEIIKEAKRIEESTLYSSKAHFAAAEFWQRLHLWLGVPATILAAAAAVSAFSQLDTHHIIGGLISIVVATLSGLATFLNPNKAATVHFAAGNSYDALHNKTRIFWTVDCRGNDSDQVLTNRIKDLSAEKDELNRKSPQIPRFAYKIARKGIAAGESQYKVDVVQDKSQTSEEILEELSSQIADVAQDKSETGQNPSEGGR